MKIIVTITTTNVATNSILPLYFPFVETKKQELNFQEVGGLVTKNNLAF